jgi:hypothetical protein
METECQTTNEHYSYPVQHSTRYEEYKAYLALEEKNKSLQHLRKVQSLNFFSRSALRIRESLDHTEAA